MTTKIRQDIEENLATEQEEVIALAPEIEEKLNWFKDQKVGVIFHWGLYAQAGIVESWQLSEEDDWARKHGSWRPTVAEIRKDYWALNQKFNPEKFDPKDWAAKCKAAGFKYMIFTTKHHDGFNMYDTAYSDYKVTAETCPFHSDLRADVFGKVTSAFREIGLGIGAYYSKADWHSPYYWLPGEHAKGRYASYDPVENPAMWAKFDDFVTRQLGEITHNYGKIDILWLDGGWVNAGNNEMLNMDRIASVTRENQSDLLIVDRTIGGQYENYVTPERKIPAAAPKKPWESNIPFAKNWGYVPNDIYKSFDELLESLIMIVTMGGNVIFGVGPKPDGTLPEEAEKLFTQLGVWLDRYGEAIYETRPATDMLAMPSWRWTQKNETHYGFIKTVDATDEAFSELPVDYEILGNPKDIYTVVKIKLNARVNTISRRKK